MRVHLSRRRIRRIRIWPDQRAPTVRAFLRFLQDHVYYATNNSNFTMVTDAAHVTLSWSFAPVIAKRDQYVDLSLTALIQRLRDILGSAST